MAQQQHSSTKNETSPESSKRALARSEQALPVRYGPSSAGRGPFSMMRRFSDDMDRMFERFLGFGRSDWPEWPRGLSETTWWPQIEVSQKGDKLVVQADIPGLKKEDVNVEVRDSELRISGERRTESERNEGGYYQSERSYGSFCRVVPLPEGAKPDTTSATFKDGVLRVEMEAPASSQGRRVEVR